MSIKVMTWIWEHSPASGTDLLMLLAIADHASDDGRDAWPSVKRLAQRTRLDERTVRRVLKRLAADGHIVIHSGGGRRSNHYEIPMTSDNTESSTLLSTPRADRHPGHHATPGQPPGQRGHDDRAALTQLRQGSPDTATPPEPSSNRPLTTTSRTRAAEPTLRLVSSDGGGGTDPRVTEVFTGLGPAWTLTPKQRHRLAPMVATALEAGWTTTALIDHLTANPDGVKSPAAVLSARLNDLPRPKPAQTDRPPWCGACDEATRHRERPDGRLERCASCHPMSCPGENDDSPVRHRRRHTPISARFHSSLRTHDSGG